MKKVVLVTGASAGIGAELGILYALDGYDVALFARRTEKLEEVKARLLKEAPNAQVECIVGDVRKREDLERAAAVIKEKFGRLDVSIANAGFPVTGKVENLTNADYQRQMDTNVYGVLNTVYATLPMILEAKGSFGIVGSVNSYVSMIGYSPYCMSKAAIKAFSDCFHLEMKAKGVSVTLLCPGIVESEIFKVDKRGEFHGDWKDPRPSALKVDTRKACKDMKRAIDHRCREAVITGHGKAFVFFTRHTPWLMSRFSWTK